MDEVYCSECHDSETGLKLIAGGHVDTEVVPWAYDASVKEHLNGRVTSRVASDWKGVSRYVVSRYRDTGEANEYGARRLEHIEVVGVFDVTAKGWKKVPDQDPAGGV